MLLIKVQNRRRDTLGAVLIAAAFSALVSAQPAVPQYTIDNVAGNGALGYDGDQEGSVLFAKFYSPIGIALDSSGKIYVADSNNNRVRVISGQSIGLLAGKGSTGTYCDNQGLTGPPYRPFTGPAASAQLHTPTGLAVDSKGNLYIADTQNNCVRVVTGTSITTAAGDGLENTPNNGDGGPANQAAVNLPEGLAIDPSSGNLYIADVTSIRIVINPNTPLAQIKTFAGGGNVWPTVGASFPKIGTQFTPAFIAVDSSGSVYVSGGVPNIAGGVVMKITGDTLTIVAGGGSSDDEGISATRAMLFHPQGIAVDSQNNLYIADEAGCRIRVVSNGIINTIAGPTGTNATKCGYSGDGGPATLASLNRPGGLALDPSGSGKIYFTDTQNNRVRVLTPAGTSGGGGNGSCSFAPGGTPATVPVAGGSGSVTVSTTPSTGCSWTALSNASWITLGTTSGTGTGPVMFTAAANMSSMARSGTITVTGQTGATAGGSQTVTLTFTVNQGGQACTVTFNPPPPVSAPADGSTGTFGVNFPATDCPWTAMPSAPWISITGGLNGVGNGTVSFSIAANDSIIPRLGAIQVAGQPFAMSQAGKAPTPGCIVTFGPPPPVSAPAGGTSGTFGVTFPQGSNNCNWVAISTASWLTVTSGATGSGNGTVGYSVSANTSVTPRSASILISGQPFTINQAGGAPSGGCIPVFSPASPVNTSASGGSGSFNVSFTSTNCPWTASSNASWLTITSGLSGNGSGTVGYAAAPNTSSSARTGSISIAGLTFRVIEAGAASAAPCTSGNNSCPVITKVINAGSFGGSTTIAPGSFVEIYGSNLSKTTRQWAGSDFTGANAPTSLDGVIVTFNDQPGYVSYVSPGQVNAQVPTTLAPGPAQVTVTNGSLTSAPFGINIAVYQPGVLAPPAFSVSGKQYAVALFSDNVTYVLPAGAIPGLPSRPAKPGENIVIYGIGAGPVADATGNGVPAGQIASGLTNVAAPVELMFGTTPAAITYSGLAPGFVGLYQYNVTVPQVPASDSVPLILLVNGTSTGQTLYTAVGQ